MEWLATAVARCSRGFPFALSGSSRSPRSPSSVSGPGIACPVADVLRRVGVGMSLVPARGAPEHLLLYPALPVPVLAGVTGDGGVPGVHHDEVRAVLEDPALDFPGEGSESSLRKSLVESVLGVRSGGTRSASSGRGHVPELEALHPDEPAESRHLLGGVPFPVVLDVPELSSKFPSLGMVTLPGPGIARAVLACVLHEPPCLPTSARCIGSVEEIPVARANRVHHAKVDADLSASSRLWHRPSELEVHPVAFLLRGRSLACGLNDLARAHICAVRYRVFKLEISDAWEPDGRVVHHLDGLEESQCCCSVFSSSRGGRSLGPPPYEPWRRLVFLSLLFVPDRVHWARYAGKNFTDRQRIKRQSAQLGLGAIRIALPVAERVAVHSTAMMAVVGISA